jgi:hypothetical protein
LDPALLVGLGNANPIKKTTIATTFAGFIGRDYLTGETQNAVIHW